MSHAIRDLLLLLNPVMKYWPWTDPARKGLILHPGATLDLNHYWKWVIPMYISSCRGHLSKARHLIKVYYTLLLLPVVAVTKAVVVRISITIVTPFCRTLGGNRTNSNSKTDRGTTAWQNNWDYQKVRSSMRSAAFAWCTSNFQFRLPDCVFLLYLNDCRVLKSHFETEGAPQVESLDNLTAGRNRKEAAMLFYKTCGTYLSRRYVLPFNCYDLCYSIEHINLVRN